MATFRTLGIGETILMLPPTKKDAPKVRVKFSKGFFRTDDTEEIKAIEAYMKTHKDLPIDKRPILTEDEWLECTSPEKMWFQYHDERLLHAKVVRAAIDYAIEKGFDIDKQVIVVDTERSTAGRGFQQAKIN
jgi:hypothetical protein